MSHRTTRLGGDLQVEKVGGADCAMIAVTVEAAAGYRQPVTIPSGPHRRGGVGPVDLAGVRNGDRRTIPTTGPDPDDGRVVVVLACTGEDGEEWTVRKVTDVEGVSFQDADGNRWRRTGEGVIAEPSRGG